MCARLRVWAFWTFGSSGLAGAGRGGVVGCRAFTVEVGFIVLDWHGDFMTAMAVDPARTPIPISSHTHVQGCQCSQLQRWLLELIKIRDAH